MTCTEARERMLVADLAELSDRGSLVGRHLEECASCRRLAVAIIGDTAALGALVARRRRVPAGRIAAAIAVPLAAAAAVVIGLVRNARQTPDVPVRPASLPAARNVSLTVGQGQRATVIKTTDPNVTVIWLSPGGTE